MSRASKNGDPRLREKLDLMSPVCALFDGCCEPQNPGGHAAWGACVRVNGEWVYREGGYCGFGAGMSNNVAEYSGFVAALTEAVKHEGAIYIRGDSRLVICHLSLDAAKRLGYHALWKMNGGLYLPYYQEAKRLMGIHGKRITLDWVPREENDICDVLSKKVLLDMGVKFKIQPEKP